MKTIYKIIFKSIFGPGARFYFEFHKDLIKMVIKNKYGWRWSPYFPNTIGSDCSYVIKIKPDKIIIMGDCKNKNLKKLGIEHCTIIKINNDYFYSDSIKYTDIANNKDGFMFAFKKPIHKTYRIKTVKYNYPYDYEDVNNVAIVKTDDEKRIIDRDAFFKVLKYYCELKPIDQNLL
jgi:hypothetical protein